ncbi:F0F1 ATP synthase subunit A [Nocardioides campestrisoli]|uniref:F0F1 ATP synthase subunit A n=1 Tax=Nocardioides campestrisoli TaxID=2736757 RepID=UPI002811C190|nr:F0F1 ATP synthase subunit A [Nocardioides campestrisoli]
MSAIAMNAIPTEGFTPPGPGDFNLPPIGYTQENAPTFNFLGETMYWGVTKPMLQLALSVVVIFAFFYYASRKRAMVPGKLQFVGEMGYGMVRNSLARDNIGSHDFMRFVPFLVSLFFFILVNNYFGLIPFIQFPSMSRIGIAATLAVIAWGVYNWVGVRKHGFLGYLKLQTVPSGMKGPVLALLIPLEFFSNILVRPVTLALRLFANMFAGHILLLLFALGGEYLIAEMGGMYIGAGILSFAMFMVICVLEMLVMFLQAYVFVLLTSMYIAGALADEH